jgi:hypothetical protein
MPESVIVALIGLVGSALGAFFGIAVNSKMMSYRLEQLEMRFKEITERQTGIDARISKLESENEVQKEQIKVANHRIEDLKRVTAK